MKKLKPSKDLQPFNVTCHFGDGSGKAIMKPRYENDFQYTSIPGGSDGCADPGCYTDNIRYATLIDTELLKIFLSYDIEMEQIEALISVSEFCEQEVVNNCTSNQLTGYSWWLDRNGNKYKYWHGDRNETAEGFFQILEIFFLLKIVSY